MTCTPEDKTNNEIEDIEDIELTTLMAPKKIFQLEKFINSWNKISFK